MFMNLPRTAQRFLSYDNYMMNNNLQGPKRPIRIILMGFEKGF